VALLGQEGLVIAPERNIGQVLFLRHYGVSSTSATWDEAAVEAMPPSAASAEEFVARLSPGDDPVLTVLAALHQVDAELPADVALARHSDTGCTCEPGRFLVFLGIEALPVAGGAGLLTVQTHDREELRIRTEPDVATSIDGGPWVRLPDLASACWYLSRQNTGFPEEVVGGSSIALACVRTMAKLAGEHGFEVEVNGLELEWTGSALVPPYDDAPDWMIVGVSPVEWCNSSA